MSGSVDRRHFVTYRRIGGRARFPVRTLALVPGFSWRQTETFEVFLTKYFYGMGPTECRHFFSKFKIDGTNTCRRFKLSDIAFQGHIFCLPDR